MNLVKVLEDFLHCVIRRGNLRGAWAGKILLGYFSWGILEPSTKLSDGVNRTLMCRVLGYLQGRHASKAFLFLSIRDFFSF